MVIDSFGFEFSKSRNIFLTKFFVFCRKVSVKIRFFYRVEFFSSFSYDMLGGFLLYIG